ncbi:hypothetical protein [Arthrobacter sp. NPDC089319]|uniref:hypothetical protein n=1 Tax=Arthrobacter sp. NPDC089319 TaxID=3155915 RepID=UPI003423917E
MPEFSEPALPKSELRESELPESGIAALHRWIEVLDELELTLASAAEATSEGEDPEASRRTAVVLWKAPQGLGPIPNELVERATKLAAAQQEAIRELRADMRQNRQELAFLEAVPTRATSGRSVYLDVNG